MLFYGVAGWGYFSKIYKILRKAYSSVNFRKMSTPIYKNEFKIHSLSWNFHHAFRYALQSHLNSKPAQLIIKKSQLRKINAQLTWECFFFKTKFNQLVSPQIGDLFLIHINREKQQRYRSIAIDNGQHEQRKTRNNENILYFIWIIFVRMYEWIFCYFSVKPV